MEEAGIYLELVLNKIGNALRSLDQSILEGQRDVEEMHDYYWQNYTEMDEYGYENFDNQQAVLRQISANEDQIRLRSRLKRMQDSPYFGRVDFIFDEEEEEAESFYIGIANFSEKTGTTPLIYDWRAPVSSLFYDYDSGRAGYDAPVGRIEGTIASKWQYKIRRGQIVYAFESDVKIDDEVLRRELGSHGDVKLKNIIQTIQKEQNAIIRNTQDRILVIQGVAGSGKTSVALHRIAYLLYHDRNTLKSSDVLILSPNRVFSDYISHILPELGEENIREMSFDIFAYHELKDVVEDTEERSDEIERLLAWEREQAAAAREGKKGLREPFRIREIHQKHSPEFLSSLREFALLAEDELMNFRSVRFKRFEVKEEDIRNRFYYTYPDIPMMNRMQEIMDHFVDEYETLTQKDFTEDELELIRQQFYGMYQTRDLYILYSNFLKSYGYRSLPHVHKEKRVLPYEDLYPMLYLKYLLFQPGPQKQVRHLVIDEMQDYSELQYQILSRLFDCPMTILGDRAQTMEEKPQDVTRFLPRIYGKKIRILQMNKSYRNTVEISEYANHLVQEDCMELFDRHGDHVEKKSFADYSAALERILEVCRQTQGQYETEAILTATEEEARKICQSLADKIPVHLIDRRTRTFERGLTVTTFYLAKGLEFDRVFTLFEQLTENQPLHRQARYISATRAMHELHVYQIRREELS